MCGNETPSSSNRSLVKKRHVYVSLSVLGAIRALELFVLCSCMLFQIFFMSLERFKLWSYFGAT